MDLACRRGQSMRGWRMALLQGWCKSFMSIYDLRKTLWRHLVFDAVEALL